MQSNALPSTGPEAGTAAGIAAATGAGIGHNSQGAAIGVEVRLFNTILKLCPTVPARSVVELAPGATIGDVVRRLGIPAHEIFLVLVNGRDVTPRLGVPVETGRVLSDGDVVAFSGPVPYSWGYGACVV